MLSLAVHVDRVYVGGAFRSIDGHRRNRIAALDAHTGMPTPWNPSADERVISFAVSGDVVYAGGVFEKIGGQRRRYLAALDAARGRATTWNPDPDSTVDVLAVDGDTIYAGGSFETIGGRAQPHLAALDVTSGAATAWHPASPSVLDLALDTSIMYVGGTSVLDPGPPRNPLAAFDLLTGQDTAWAPHLDGLVTALAVAPHAVYIGRVNSGPQRHLQGIDRSTGGPTAFNPQLGEPSDPGFEPRVLALTWHEGTLWAGGDFGRVERAPQRNIAAFRVPAVPPAP